ncbi:MAG TPA: ABC transporter permease [Longimicrobium sp.]|jgi:putative ABC transport system permease protein
MDTLLQDLRFAMRALGRSPGFALVAVATLALGIGVNTTMFSVVNSILLRPPAHVDPDGLVVLRTLHQKSGDESSVSYPNFVDWQAGSPSFQAMGAYYDDRMILTGRGAEPEEVSGEVVSAGLFSMLGARAALGRTFLPEEGKPGAARVVVIAHQEWERRFERDPRIVGSTLSLDGVPHTVIGVMPKNFGFPDNQTFWTPLRPEVQEERGSRYMSVIGRLRPGATLQQARAELDAVSRELARRYPETNAGSGVRATDFSESWSGEVRAPLLVMMGAVGFVLLIACSNVANLLLARAAARRREIAVRVAIGAGRGRIVRQLLTESALVSLLGGALGIGLAMWGLRLIMSSFPFQPPLWMVFDIDRTVLLFVLGVSLGTGLLFGLAPALRATSGDLQGVLRDGGRGSTTGARRGRLQSALVMGQLALAAVLLTGALLMVRSFVHLNSADPGFRLDGAVSMRITVSGERYETEAARTAFFRQVLDRVRPLPGVASAGMADWLPLSGGSSTSGVMVDGREVPGSDRPDAEVRRTTDGFAEAMGLRLRAGRPFTAHEAAAGAPVVVVSRSMAERFWPGQSALGHTVSTGGDWRTVIGVVDDISGQHRGDAPRPQLYFPAGDHGSRSMALVARTPGDAAALAPALRRAIREIDPGVAVADVHTMAEVAGQSLWKQRLFGGMFASFGFVALLLAVTGVYAMMAYAVAQRIHEIGVRMALGARTGQVLRMVVGQGLTIAAIGVGIGLAGALAVTRLMAGLLEGVSPSDPLTFALVALLLASVAVLASWLPARRAARVDPMIALRSE